MELSSPAPPSPIAEGSLPPVASSGTAPRPTEGFSTVLRTLGGRIDEGAQLMARAERTGPALDARQLIALQAGIYRYTESVELAAKLIDRANNAIKTTLQSQ
jgi:hypothetical protein